MSYCLANVVSKIMMYGLIFFQLGYLMNLYFAFWVLLQLVLAWAVKVMFFNFTLVVLLLVCFPILTILREGLKICRMPGKLAMYIAASAVMIYFGRGDFEIFFQRYGTEFLVTCGAEGGLVAGFFLLRHLEYPWVREMLDD